MSKKKDNAPKLSDSDWVEIYYALDSVATRVERGEYGPEDKEGDDEEWISHLRDIMSVIERFKTV
jgi:hypothetical protein